MIVFSILEIKNFMSKLLLQECFDAFCLEEAGILTFAMMRISGKRNLSWYDPGEEAGAEDLQKHREPAEELIYWSEVKNFIVQYIKGAKTPSMMKISLKVDKERLSDWLEEYGVMELCRQQSPELFLNIRYEQQELHIISGISFPQFTMDRRIESAWDQALQKWFLKQQIPYEIVS